MHRPRFILAAALVLSCGGTNPLSSVNGFTTVSTDVCPSGTQWNAGNRESELMQPGLDCVACHRREREGPLFTIAGTVYQDVNTRDGCSGASELKVVITGSDGQVLTLTSNAAGNFFSEARVALPFKAKVVSASGEREMVAPQSVGTCNSCHTQTGAESAPGRILAP